MWPDKEDTIIRLKNGIMTALGFVLLGLGLAGVFLPVLPTTPFVLAAAACFSGNPRLTGWLYKNKMFGVYLENYRRRSGLPKRVVVTSLIYLWLGLGTSIVLIGALWASVLLPCIGVAVTIHILYMARPKKNEQS